MITIPQAIASESTGTTMRPRIALTSDHGTATMAVMANIAPPALHCDAISHSPRTTCDQAVVMPQEGQGFWKSSTNVQRGSPSCWCVPRPVASGWSHRAMPSIASSPKPKTASDARARDERVTSRTSAPNLEKRAEDSRCRLTSQYRFEWWQKRCQQPRGGRGDKGAGYGNHNLVRRLYPRSSGASQTAESIDLGLVSAESPDAARSPR